MAAPSSPLRVGVDPVLDLLIDRAHQVHALRQESATEAVSGSSILYAAATLDPLVLAVLETNGLRRAVWEHDLGFEASPRFTPPKEPPLDLAVTPNTITTWQALESIAPSRQPDLLMIATAFLMIPSARVNERLRTAGLDVKAAAARAMEFVNASAEHSLIQTEKLGYTMTGTAHEVLTRAASLRIQHTIGFPANTASEVFIAALMLETSDPLKATSALRGFVASAAEGWQSICEEWLDGYERGDANPNSDLCTAPLIAILERAAHLARESRRGAETTIYTRHLVGALIASSRWAANTGIPDLLTNLDISATHLAKRYLSYLETSPAPSGRDDMSVWRRFLGFGSETYVPRFDAEAMGGHDLLQITDEVEAFASLLASNKIAPPLSIGLFGDWGSGKSFFMAALREQIAERASRAGGPDKSVFLPRIVQIDFNAWHYVEANLWASLVEHLFRNLKLTYEKPDDKRIEERRNELLQKLDGAMAERVEAEKKLQQAEIARDHVAQNLDARRMAVEANVAVANGLKAKDLWDFVSIDNTTRASLQAALEKAGVNTAIQSNEELRKTLGEIRGTGARAKLLASWTARQPRVLALLLALLVLAPFGVASVVELLRAARPWFSGGAFVAWAAATTVIANWLKNIAAKGKTVLDAVDAARKAIDARIHAAEAERQRQIDAAEGQLSGATLAVAAAQAAVEEKEQKVAQAKKELVELTNGYRLTRFIDERAASDDYRKLLGVLATVRSDFSTLSELMYPPSGNSNLDDKLKIDRIILYIDDLDRCPPERVVDVLQAVHLLLAFKLFVVVVGVDARWVSESLRQKHRALRGKQNDVDGQDDGVAGYAVAPHDYLEKIFQVPFWLQPMGARTSNFIASLLAADVVGTDAEQQNTAVTATSTAGSASQMRTPRRSGQTVRHTVAETENGETDPKPLTINPIELDFMKGGLIAPLVSRSPRTAKRFVNTYRFFRASLPPESIATYLAERSPAEYKCALLLLAIVVGAPDVSVELFDEMRRRSSATVEAFASGVAVSAEHATQWHVVINALKTFEEGAVPVTSLLEQLPRVIRYSFRAPYAPAAQKQQPQSAMIPITTPPHPQPAV